MAGLIDMIRGSIGPETIDGLAAQLGESPQNTGNALTNAIPVILAALAGRAEGGNLGSIVDMLKSAVAGGNPLDRTTSLSPAALTDSGGLLSGLLGGSLGTIAQTLASRFGISADSFRAILGAASMFGAGGIARALNGNITANGLTDLLRRERPSIDAALPSGVSGMLGSFGSTASNAGASAADAVEDAGGGLARWLPWIALAIAAIIAIALLRTCSTDHETVNTTTTTVTTEQANTVDATMPPPAATVPVGSGVVSETREGRPALVVYFDTGKSEVSKDLTAAATQVKDYLTTHAGSTLAVSGFNDPTGNAAANAALSKRRAEEVSKALAATGIPAASIKLEKPADTTATGDTNAQSRRVEVTVRD